MRALICCRRIQKPPLARLVAGSSKNSHLENGESSEIKISSDSKRVSYHPQGVLFSNPYAATQPTAMHPALRVFTISGYDSIGTSTNVDDMSASGSCYGDAYDKLAASRHGDDFSKHAGSRRRDICDNRSVRSNENPYDNMSVRSSVRSSGEGINETLSDCASVISDTASTRALVTSTYSKLDSGSSSSKDAGAHKGKPKMKEVSRGRSSDKPEKKTKYQKEPSSNNSSRSIIQDNTRLATSSRAPNNDYYAPANINNFSGGRKWNDPNP